MGDSKPKPSAFRRVFRWFRITLWVLLLLVVAGGFYLNKAGLPEGFKQKLVKELRSKGWDVDFSRIRLRYYRGILVESLQFRPTNQYSGPIFFVDEAQCRLNYKALLDFELDVHSIMMRDGRLIMPFAETNQVPLTIRLENLNGELQFLPDDCWQLNSLTAECFDAEFRFEGIITNALDLRFWNRGRFGVPEPKLDGPTPLARLQTILNLADLVEFSGVPRIHCNFQGDARDPSSFQARLGIQAPGVSSPWGSGTNLVASTRVVPTQASAEAVQAEVSFSLQQALSPWGQADEIRMYLHGQSFLEHLMPTNLNLAIELHNSSTRWGQCGLSVFTAKSSASSTNENFRQTEFSWWHQNLRTTWGRAVSVSLDGVATHPFQGLLPLDWTGNVGMRQASTPWFDVETADLEVTIGVPRGHSLARFGLDWPDRLAGIPLQVSGSLTNLNSRGLIAQDLQMAAAWASPELALGLEGVVADGAISLSAGLNAVTRKLEFDASSQADPLGIKGWLTPKAQVWMEKYQWAEPPLFEGRGHLILPPWDADKPDWAGVVRPSLYAEGRFELGFGSYRGVPFTSARSPYVFSNSVWRLTDLYLTRPEGQLKGSYVSHALERNFHWDLQSQINPTMAIPLLESEKARKALGFFEFYHPPLIKAELWGNWDDKSQVGFAGEVTASNFVFRGESIEFFQADLEFADGMLTGYKPRVRRNAVETAQADGLSINTRTQKLYLTNGVGRMDPQVVAKLISPKALDVISPYQFARPLQAIVNGVVDIKRKRQEYDLRFDIDGGPFRWRMFGLDQVKGQLHWLGETLSLQNMEGRLHGGEVAGHGWFDFTDKEKSRFEFSAEVTNVNFHTFTEQISGNTNKLEGQLNGLLVVTNAVISDWDSWQGYGRVKLQDGLIWDIPMFQVFSSILNLVIPGLGNSRARQATASYTITNSVIHTQDLDVRATLMHMQFKGTSDFDRNINGRMEAELLKGVPGIGLIVSKVLWPVTKLFEYKLSGTIEDPITKPLYIFPKILLLPLNPIKGLKSLLGLDEEDPPRETPSQD